MKRKVDKIIDEQYFRQEGEYLAEGSLHIKNNAKFNKLVVKGNLIVDGTICAEEVVVDGNLVVGKSISAKNLRVGGNLKVNGKVCLEGNLHVKGDCEIENFAPKYSNIYVGGKFKTEIMTLFSCVQYISIGYSANS